MPPGTFMPWDQVGFVTYNFRAYDFHLIRVNFFKLIFIYRALDCDHFLRMCEKIWCLCECMVCTAPKRLLHTARAAEPQHIVAGVRFHWSREESASASVEPGLYSPRQHERRGARSRLSAGRFGFQTKVKHRFLNQRRWTCWYSCRKKHASPVSDSQFSFTFLFVFVLKSLLSLPFTSCYDMEAFLIFLYYYYLIPQCLLNILLCIRRYI